MNKLNLPEYSFKIQQKGEGLMIFDELRKKYLVLTPEEWVRQNLIKFLVSDKGYPSGLISQEAGLKINAVQKRYDALIFDKTGVPLVLIECKAPDVTINKKVFEQILAYNRTIGAPFLLVSNGMKHYFLRRGANNQFLFEHDLPDFKAIK